MQCLKNRICLVLAITTSALWLFTTVEEFPNLTFSGYYRGPGYFSQFIVALMVPLLNFILPLAISLIAIEILASARKEDVSGNLLSRKARRFRHFGILVLVFPGIAPLFPPLIYPVISSLILFHHIILRLDIAILFSPGNIVHLLGFLAFLVGTILSIVLGISMILTKPGHHASLASPSS